MRDLENVWPGKLADTRQVLTQDLASEQGGGIDLIRLPSLPGIEVMNVRDVSRQWVYFHETYSFCVASRVASTENVPWRYRLRTHSMNVDGVQLMEPGELHANLIDAPHADFRVLFLSPEKVERAARELGWESTSPLHLRVAQLGDGAVRSTLRNLTAALVDDGDVERSELGIYRLLETLSRCGCFETGIPTRRSPHCRGESAAWKARDLIHAHWNDHLPVGAIGAVVGIPVSTLERAFTRAYGTSPRQYQTHLRLMRAKEMLKTGHTVAVAATDAGFRDPDYFARLFRREFGCGPHHYRLAAGAGTRRGVPRETATCATLHK
jgi:AraC-like DNA-binding protein